MQRYCFSIKKFLLLWSYSLIDKWSCISANKSTVIIKLLIQASYDHNMSVYVVTRYIQKETLNKTCIKKRVINDVTKKAFLKDLEKCNWDEILAEEDVNITYNKFVNLFTNVFNTNCPVNISKLTQGKRKYKRPDKPWMTTGFKNACKKKKLVIQTIPKKQNN